MSRFEQARYLSELACCLDERCKTEFTADELACVEHCVDALHVLAMNLAGDRVSTIYANDAEFEVPSVRHIGKVSHLF